MTTALRYDAEAGLHIPVTLEEDPMVVWILMVDEFANDEGSGFYGVYANRELAEEAFATALQRNYPEPKVVVKEEDLSAGDTITIVRWVNTPGGDEFEADNWTIQSRPVQGA